MTLTNATIAAAKPGDTIRDEDVKGLHVRAFPNRKSFYLYYRTRAGEERKPKLGDVGVLTLNDARRIAKKLLQEVSLGHDPAGKWKSDKTSTTVSEWCDVYLAKKLPKCRNKNAEVNLKIVVEHIRKRLGTRKVSTLELDDGESLHAAVTKRGPIQANRVIATLSSMMTMAEKHKLRPLNSNFCAHVERNPERKRKRYLRPGDEAKAIGAALRAHLYGPRHESALFVLLLLLTGARKGELAGALEANRDGPLLVIPEHKTVNKTQEEKTIFLSDAAVSLLDDPLRPAHDRVGYLLGVASPKELWEEVRATAGCPDLRLHDLRHTFASFGINAGLNLSMVGPLLGHASEQTTKRYAHLIDGPASAAANLISNSVEAALAEPKKEAAE
jgi:integrase